MVALLSLCSPFSLPSKRGLWRLEDKSRDPNYAGIVSAALPDSFCGRSFSTENAAHAT